MFLGGLRSFKFVTLSIKPMLWELDGKNSIPEFHSYDKQLLINSHRFVRLELFSYLMEASCAESYIGEEHIWLRSENQPEIWCVVIRDRKVFGSFWDLLISSESNFLFLSEFYAPKFPTLFRA